VCATLACGIIYLYVHACTQALKEAAMVQNRHRASATKRPTWWWRGVPGAGAVKHCHFAWTPRRWPATSSAGLLCMCLCVCVVGGDGCLCTCREICQCGVCGCVCMRASIQTTQQCVQNRHMASATQRPTWWWRGVPGAGPVRRFPRLLLLRGGLQCPLESMCAWPPGRATAHPPPPAQQKILLSRYCDHVTFLPCDTALKILRPCDTVLPCDTSLKILRACDTLLPCDTALKILLTCHTLLPCDTDLKILRPCDTLLLPCDTALNIHLRPCDTVMRLASRKGHCSSSTSCTTQDAALKILRPCDTVVRLAARKCHRPSPTSCTTKIRISRY
jgi:hypothetical protein